MAYREKESKSNTLEDYFVWYIQELKDNGFIKDFKREKFAIEIAPQMNLKRYDLSTKTPKIEDFRILQQATYKPDYTIEWYPHAKEVFFNYLDGEPVRVWCPFYAQIDSKGTIFSLVDVKPPSGAQVAQGFTSGATFPIIQKILYYMHGIFINKAIPIPLVKQGSIKSGNNVALFVTTFVPNRYLLSDKLTKARDIKYNKRSLKEYVSHRIKDIDRLNLVFSKQGELNLQ